MSHAFKYIRLESYEDGAVLIERFQALEHPVIDVFKRVLEADQHTPLLSRAHQKQLAFFRLGALYPELTHPGM